MNLTRYRKFIRRARSTPLKALRRAWTMYRTGGVGGMVEVVQTYTEINRQYALWRTKQKPQPYSPAAVQPLISVIMPTYNSHERWLRCAIDSVLAQTYPNWELCIADDASTNGRVQAVLDEYARRDKRIHVRYREVNGHISAASNTALEMASGEYIALLDHDDEISPDALAEVVALLNQHPDADFVYSDEDKLEPDGVTHTEPFFKPGWSPRLLLSCNYITHFAVIRRSLVQQVGGFRDAFVGSQDHDLFLRVTDHTDKVYHIPKVLYSWRKIASSTADGIEAKKYALDAAERAVKETITRRGMAGTVERGIYEPFLRLRPTIPKPYRVTIIAPDNSDRDWRLDVEASRDDFVLFRAKNAFLDLRMTALLIELAGQTDVGCVGGKIVNKDSKLLHAGIALGVNGVAGFPGCGAADITQAIFYMDLKDTIREVSAVSWGFMLVEREKLLKVGGMDAAYQHSLFDVDLCLRLREAGYTNLYTPYARLVAISDAFLAIDPADAVYFRERWGERVDPYYNPNLTHSATTMHIDCQ